MYKANNYLTQMSKNQSLTDTDTPVISSGTTELKLENLLAFSSADTKLCEQCVYIASICIYVYMFVASCAREYMFVCGDINTHIIHVYV